MNISVVSGGFDPIHSGHISYISAAAEHGDYLIIALNSDQWLANKKGKEFMPFSERKIILENLKFVDEVIAFDDDEIGSATNALKKIKEMYPEAKIKFCNGGDRGKDNIPEMAIDGIEFVFGVGGNNKKNSSSWILKKWQYDSEERVWGKFFNLYKDNRVKLKELIISPGKGISMQRHFKRDEIWFVSNGKCKVNYSKTDPEEFEVISLSEDSLVVINRGDWHQIFNPYSEECKIVEIQYGSRTDEEDIERHSYYKNDKT